MAKSPYGYHQCGNIMMFLNINIDPNHHNVHPKKPSKEEGGSQYPFNVQLDLLLNQVVKGKEKKGQTKFLREKINMSPFFFIFKSFGLEP